MLSMKNNLPFLMSLGVPQSKSSISKEYISFYIDTEKYHESVMAYCMSATGTSEIPRD